ncbi:MAG: hypothetical protein GX968_05030 [Tissierellia bacterium]|nr:hypothetical protein [Tissierellia bacterium]
MTDLNSYLSELDSNTKIHFPEDIMNKYNLDAIAYSHQKRPVVKVGKIKIDRNSLWYRTNWLLP